ncbi:MAG: hypothetical protein KKA60_03315 [Proteobacteria bacterium]|nr:hypothetical protein [Pseudomonadota bacterium]
MKCPLCGCGSFYVKDPEDEYETYHFAWGEGGPVYEEDYPCPPEMDATTTVHCENCAWKGGLGQLGASR